MNSMHLPHFQTADEVQTELLDTLLNGGNPVEARRMKTREIHPAGFVLTNPRARCLSNTARKWSFPLAIGELAWHLSASDDVNFIGHYAKQWKNFSDDGKVIKESCYGHKIFGKSTTGYSQWDNVVRLLQHDPNSRRAVLSLYDVPAEFDPFAKDVSCICTIQFMIREDKLDAITQMRSNDVIWGLPYDLFLVTMLQELLAVTLGVVLGHYYHFANSMHLYERHFDLARAILNAPATPSSDMSAMTDIDQIPRFIAGEKTIRTAGGTALHRLPATYAELAPYWKNLLDVLHRYAHSKQQRTDTMDPVMA
jgi:thymidylate synthase